MLGTATAPSSSSGAASSRDVPAAAANPSTPTAPPTTTAVIATRVARAPRRLQAPRRKRVIAAPPVRSHQLALVEREVEVAGLDDGGVVGGDDDDGAARRLLPQLGEHDAAVALVELGGRLVGEQHAGADDEAAGARDALHLAARELLDLALAEVGDAEPGQGGLGVLVGVGGRGAAGAQGDRDVLAGREDRHQAVDLEDERDLGPRVAAARPRVAPASIAVPDVACSRPPAMESRVVLPEPLGPDRAVTLPAGKVTTTSSSSVRPAT